MSHCLVFLLCDDCLSTLLLVDFSVLSAVQWWVRGVCGRRQVGGGTVWACASGSFAEPSGMEGPHGVCGFEKTRNPSMWLWKDAESFHVTLKRHSLATFSAGTMIDGEFSAATWTADGNCSSLGSVLQAAVDSEQVSTMVPSWWCFSSIFRPSPPISSHLLLSHLISSHLISSHLRHEEMS